MMPDKIHKVTVEEISSVLDNEIILASSYRAASPKRKRLVFVPSIKTYSVRVFDDGVEIRSPFDSIHDAVINYNR